MANTKKDLPDSFWLLVDRLKEIANALNVLCDKTVTLNQLEISDALS